MRLCAISGKTSCGQKLCNIVLAELGALKQQNLGLESDISRYYLPGKREALDVGVYGDVASAMDGRRQGGINDGTRCAKKQGNYCCGLMHLTPGLGELSLGH